MKSNSEWFRFTKE